MRISFVLWNGRVGGAERAAVSLAGELRRQGVETSVLFIGSDDALRSQLDHEGVPSHHLGLTRGSMVLRHPRRLARAIQEQHADAAILDVVGFLGLALRAGGFRGAVVGVEHGVLLQLPALPLRQRIVRLIDRASGIPFHDAEVAVSRYLERRVRERVHVRRTVCIPNGVDVRNPAGAHRLREGSLHLGFAGRLIAGKGVDRLIDAIYLLRKLRGRDVQLAVAGDGPLRRDLETHAAALGLERAVCFKGWTDDLAGFWSGCDVAVASNDTFPESFCMSIAEAMSYGLPAVVTETGALPELVVHGQTGFVVPSGDVRQLADALARYLDDPVLVRVHGQAARKRVEDHYSLSRCAQRYRELADLLVRQRSGSSSSGAGGRTA